MNEIKVLSLSPNPSDGTSWYRAGGPLAHLEKNYPNFSFVEGGAQDPNWELLMRFHVLFIQRPCHDWQHRVIKKAKFLGLKIWIDFDDLLWGLPLLHRNHTEYVPLYDEIRRIIMEPGILITVSTQALAYEVLDVNENANVHVVVNGIDFSWNYFQETLNDSLVCWRGSDTHDIDLYPESHYIKGVLEKYKTEFIGYAPKEIVLEHQDNAIVTKGLGLLEYFAYIKMNRKWKTFFVCLTYNPFNTCKSNIAWLEATLCGALCVAPDTMPEWNQPGVTLYGDALDSWPDLFSAVEYTMKLSDNERDALLKESQKAIYENYNLDKLNEQRYILLNNLINE